jgi:hypothetical protein
LTGLAHPPVIVVSGLPRSGTSMMMQMLSAGGLEPWTDGVRRADEDNPAGYFECERVKHLAEDNAWITHARGRVVKVVSRLLRELPADEEYRVLFMRRDLSEVLASQRAMLRRQDRPAEAEDDRLAGIFAEHLRQVEEWLARQPNHRTLWIDHRQVIAEPMAVAERVAGFLDRPLDVAAMARAVDPRLYRQRIGSMGAIGP